MEHTKEPWQIDQHGNIQTPDGQLYLGGVRTAMTAGSDNDRQKANARRIVACVNACKGMTIEQLEWLPRKGGVVGHYDMLETRWLSSCKQRDDLLATSIALLEYMQKIESGIDVPDEIFCPWEEAISKAECRE